MNLKQCVKDLASTIKGHFEALNFKAHKNGKSVFLRLGDNLDVDQVIARLNNKRLKSVCLRAFIPNVIPQLSVSSRPYTIPTKMRRSLKIPPNLSPNLLLVTAREGIMREMQTKFTGLHDLSMKVGHRLLDDIGTVIHERLLKIIQKDDTPFKLTRSYRNRHQHSTDFPLILSTYHAILDKEGKPKIAIEEKELTKVALEQYAKVPTQLYKLHIDRISAKVEEHVTNLEVATKTSTPEEAAQMKVRKQLKNMTPHLASYVNQVITNRFMPPEDSFCVVKIYGEPYLPGRDIMAPFSKQYCAVSTIRSENMYNLLSLKVPKVKHLALLQADGTSISNATLVIRPSKMPYYKMTRVLPHVGDEQLAHNHWGKSLESTNVQDPNNMEWSDTW